MPYLNEDFYVAGKFCLNRLLYIKAKLWQKLINTKKASKTKATKKRQQPIEMSYQSVAMTT